MAKLLLTNGTGLAQQFSLGSGVSRVGRNSDNDIHLEHPSVSGFHCEITAAGDLFTIKDLGSTNGTFIDGRPIQQASLAHGQRLQLGQVELLLEAAGAEQTASVPFPATQVISPVPDTVIHPGVPWLASGCVPLPAMTNVAMPESGTNKKPWPFSVAPLLTSTVSTW